MFAASKTASVSSGYQISRSLRFNSADSTNLNRTPSVAANQQIWTFSIWLKRSRIGADYEGIFSSGNGTDQIRFENNDVFRFGLNGSTAADFLTTQVFRDVSAWYHIVVAVDTTQATASNRVKIYVNGTQVTSFSTANYPSQNYNTFFNNTADHRIGSAGTSSYYFNGYMTEFNWIGGLQLTPSSFGETNAQTGVWQPKAYSGSYGTNGFYLNFSDNSNTTAATLGKDYSGNGNNWTPNNFSVTAGAGNDSLVDSPTLYGTDTGVGGSVRGNYCTLNPLIKPVGTVTYSDGNLVGTNSGSNWNAMGGTIGISTGKWYWEYTSPNQNSFFGIMVPSINFSSGNPQDANAAAGSVLLCDDNKYQIDYNARVAYTGTSHPAGTIVGVAVDMDAGTIVFYLNGTSQGSITWTSSAAYGKTVIPMAIAYDTATTTTANFGQRPFAYTAPSGFKALCTQNLPTPTIGATTATQAGKYFDTSLYTGNAGALTVTNSGFQPDFLWIKRRDASGPYHNAFDSVRGVNKILFPNVTDAEYTSANYLTSFNSGGFTLGAGDTGTNANGATYVGWQWRAGNSSGSTNTAGSITSTVSANTTSGFSIITWTGNATQNATIGHGLGAKPAFFVVKNRTSGPRDWPVKFKTFSTSQYIYLNGSGAVASFGFYFPTEPTSSVIYLGSDADVNGNGNSMVCYAFTEIAGYSAMGSYTGNGSTDGPFIYTGFKPAFLLTKNISSAGQYWDIYDSKRNTANPETLRLFPNASDAEGSATQFDFLSNGFKVISGSTSSNGSGNTIIYIAFAESPFKYSLAR